MPTTIGGILGPLLDEGIYIASPTEERRDMAPNPGFFEKLFLGQLPVGTAGPGGSGNKPGKGNGGDPANPANPADLANSVNLSKEGDKNMHTNKSNEKEFKGLVVTEGGLNALFEGRRRAHCPVQADGKGRSVNANKSDEREFKGLAGVEGEPNAFSERGPRRPQSC